jgi:hypothetical protein
MTIFKETDLKDLPKAKKSKSTSKKVKNLVRAKGLKLEALLSRGEHLGRGTVTPKWIASQIAKKSPLGRVWKKVPKKQQQQVTNLLSRGYAAAKGVATGAAILTTAYVAAHAGRKAAKLKKRIVNKAKKRSKTQSMKHGGKVRSYNFIN